MDSILSQLLSSLHETPLDDVLRSILADRLEDLGDPRALTLRQVYPQPEVGIVSPRADGLNHDGMVSGYPDGVTVGVPGLLAHITLSVASEPAVCTVYRPASATPILFWAVLPGQTFDWKPAVGFPVQSADGFTFALTTGSILHARVVIISDLGVSVVATMVLRSLGAAWHHLLDEMFSD